MASARTRAHTAGEQDGQAGLQPPACAWITAYCDGGSRGNPGPAGYGVYIQDDQGQVLAELSHFLGTQTNNFAEYSGLLAALEFAAKTGHRCLRVVSDSELMVKQMNGRYRVNSPELRRLYEQAQGLVLQLDRFEIRHVLREKNHHADRLANLAMDQGRGKAVRPRVPEYPAEMRALEMRSKEGQDGVSAEDMVLVLARREDPQLAMLRALPHVVGGEAAAFAEAAKDARVIFNWTGSRELLRTVFGMCGKLRWVHSRLAGVDTMLFPELVESDVLVTNSKGVYSAALGEFALGAILYFAKDFPRMIRNQAAGRWEPFDVDEIQGQTAGIVGYGDIGRAVATRVRAMGMRVLASKRHLPPPPDRTPGPLSAPSLDPLVDRFFGPDELHELLAQCDYVVVATPLTAETRHLLGEREFAAMKPTAVVINIGRGPVIDHQALVRALTTRRIKGAGLDVCEQEPLPAGDPLYRLENVLLSPHCADHTRDWMDQAMRFFLEQYRRFENQQPLQNILNKRLGY